jgi:MFS transporter, YNFM family, putative membrane transport protein
MASIPPMQPALIALAAASFVSGANLRLFDALLPTIAESFDVLPTTASVVVTAFTLAYGSSQLVHGPLGDRIGKIRVVAISSFIAAFASLGSVFVDSLSGLAALRFFTGIGAGGMIPLALAWIGDNTPYEKRQTTLGRFIGIVLVGHIFGPALGGLLSHFATWRAVFGVFAAMFFAAGFVLLAQDRKAPFTRQPQTQRRNVFRHYVSVLKDRWVRTVLITVFLEGAMFYGAFAYTGAYLKARFDLSYDVIGVIIAAFGLGGVCYSLSVRWLLRRLGESGLVATGSGVLLTCYLLLPTLPVWWPMIPVLFAAGVGFYMFHNTLQTRSTEMAPQSRGTALALHAFSMFMGQAIGVALCGLSIRFANYGWTFVLAGCGLVLLGRAFSARVRHHNARHRSGHAASGDL